MLDLSQQMNASGTGTGGGKRKRNGHHKTSTLPQAAILLLNEIVKQQQLNQNQGNPIPIENFNAK